MLQLSLFDVAIAKPEAALLLGAFSHDGVCPEDARLELEMRYGSLLQETSEFNRQLVSFQANKTQVLHNWIKYREGFSASLVEILLGKFGLRPGDTVLDPFAGSCTTLLVAQALGINGVGIELLPNSHLAWEAKSRAYTYDLAELRLIQKLLRETIPPATSDRFPHLAITETAFPDQTEQDLMAYSRWLDDSDLSENARLLYRLALMSTLEDISYTRKDGQYLRWDGRAAKAQANNAKRKAKGLVPIEGIDKGDLPTVQTALARVWDKICADVTELQKDAPPVSSQRLIEGSTLYVLPELAENQFDAVITSPPYANRYDYTRTYALELAFLGVGDAVLTLRQHLLSCTVENRPKWAELRAYYESIGRLDEYTRVETIVQNNAVLAEISKALRIRNERGEINNTGVLGMVDQYFAELTFVYAELYRTCRSAAQVAFINDNVRYAGEIVPVDMISTQLAEAVGFEPVQIWVLPQRKGNSSQQMEKYGRVELRKSITVWRKP